MVSLQHVLQGVICVLLAGVGICTVVIPGGLFDEMAVVILCAVAIILLLCMVVIHLVKHHSFYGIARILLCTSLICLLAGIACGYLIGHSESVQLKAGDTMTFAEDGLKDRTIGLESVRGPNTELVYHISWTLPGDVTIHDTISKGEPFKYKHVEVRLDDGNIVGGTFVVRNALCASLTRAGSIGLLVMLLVCPFLGRRKEGNH
mgnify:CR=1 FL=1